MTTENATGTSGADGYAFGLPGSEAALQTLRRLSLAGGIETVIVPGSPGELEAGLSVIL